MRKITIILLVIGVFTLMAFVSTKQQDKETFSIGTYSMSLNVKDISKSKDFYSKLGFFPIEGMGSIEQKWIILSNGEAKIGLFQGMFPSNTITFNPEDARTIYKKLETNGVTSTFETGMDKNRRGLHIFNFRPRRQPYFI